ncbi:serine/threonine-protein kinase [Embleya hyalina]|uniref:serine/threonine-protein kinase n=1 Tax=Embleya hyalina TaxID=516124 RepID=UPI002483088A|nr:serine/threonine-protein kinase [Embleya hyalina]
MIGPYRLSARLGEGGMGEVFLGRSPGGMSVAVKVVHADLAELPGYRERFAHEIAAARAVGGAFTAAVVDSGDMPRPWMATVYLPGVSLLRAVTDHGPLSYPVARVLGAGLAEALVSIHRAGIVHRDLKPSNILLTSDGPRVLDFGVARADDRDTVTESGAVLGSLPYMAPEQLFGRPPGPAVDVYALGGVLVYCVTGAPPLGEVPGGAPGLLHRITAGPPDLRAVSDPSLRELLIECLAENPEARPATADLVVRLLPDGAGHGHRSGAGVTVPGDWMPVPLTGSIAEQATRAREALAETTVSLAPDASHDARPTPGDLPDEPAPPAPRPARRSAARAQRARAVLPRTLPPPRLMAPVAVDAAPSRRRVLRALLAAGGLAAAGTIAWAATRSDGGGSSPDTLWTAESRMPFVKSASGGRVFVADPATKSLLCLDAGSGREVWRSQGTDSLLMSDSSALLALADVLVTRSLGELAVRDINTGVSRWSKPVSPIGPDRQRIAADDSFVYGAVPGDAIGALPVLHAYRRDGTIAWRREVTGGKAGYVRVTGGPVLLANRLVVTGNTGIGTGACFAAAYEPRSGAPLWVRELPGDDEPSHPVGPTPDTVYVGNGRYTVFALDGATGAPRWSAAPQFAPDGRDESGNVLDHSERGAEPLIANGVMYVGGDDRTIRAFDTTNGSRLWTRPVQVSAKVTIPGDACLPVIVGDTAFIQDTRALVAVGARDGHVLWSAPLLNDVDSPPPRPVVVDGLLHTVDKTPDGDGELRSYDPSDATLVRTIRFGTGRLRLTAGDGVLFLASNRLTALSPRAR